MRTGAEIKVGIITVVAVALLLGYTYYIRGYRAAAASYDICVIFDNARGLQRGDPVRMAGVKIGEVSTVEVSPELKAKITLSIENQYELYDDYKFQIATTGIIQERVVEVIPADRTPYSHKLTAGVCVEGILQPTLTDLMVSGSQVLESLNKTSRGINVLLSDQDILRRAEEALKAFSTAAAAAAELATTTATISQQSQPEILVMLSELRKAAEDTRIMTSELRQHATKGTALDDLEAAAANARAASANAERISAALASLTTDPQTQQQLRETLAAVHDAALSAQQIGKDLEVFSGELREAAPTISKVAQEAEAVVGTAGALRERLKPPTINAAFDVLYNGEDERWFSSGQLDFQTRPDRFLRFGIDDIGEESNANIQLGERHGNKTLRYGLVRSRLGLGVDYRVTPRATLSADLFDPNNLRGDVLADIAVLPGRADLSLLLGVRDLGDDALFVGGVRVTR